jgi:hypothetical protein
VPARAVITYIRPRARLGLGLGLAPGGTTVTAPVCQSDLSESGSAGGPALAQSLARLSGTCVPLPPPHPGRPGEEARARHAPEVSDSVHVDSRPESGHSAARLPGPHTSEPTPARARTHNPVHAAGPARESGPASTRNRKPDPESEARLFPLARHQVVTGRARPWRQRSTSCSRSPAPRRRGRVRYQQRGIRAAVTKPVRLAW